MLIASLEKLQNQKFLYYEQNHIKKFIIFSLCVFFGAVNMNMALYILNRFKNFCFTFIYFVCVWVEENLWEFTLSFYPLGPRIDFRVLNLATSAFTLWATGTFKKIVCICM